MRKRIIHFAGTTLIVSFLFLFVSCKAKYANSELDTFFTKSEIQDLDKIRYFFTSQMCYCMDTDFKTCYKNTPHEYLELSGNAFWTIIDYDKQKQLYQEISQSTFDAIWDENITTYYPSKQSGISLGANPTGKFQKFLARIGKGRPKIAEYAKHVMEAGIYDGLGAWYPIVLGDQKNFDLNNPDIQLMLAVHYLTLNDDNMRNRELMHNPRPILKKWEYKAIPKSD